MKYKYYKAKVNAVDMIMFYIFTQICSVHHCYCYYTAEERLSHAAHVNSVHVRSLTPVMLLVLFTCDC